MCAVCVLCMLGCPLGPLPLPDALFHCLGSPVYLLLPENHCHTTSSLSLKDRPVDLGDLGMPKDSPREQKRPRSLTGSTGWSHPTALNGGLRTALALWPHPPPPTGTRSWVPQHWLWEAAVTSLGPCFPICKTRIIIIMSQDCLSSSFSPPNKQASKHTNKPTRKCSSLRALGTRSLQVLHRAPGMGAPRRSISPFPQRGAVFIHADPDCPAPLSPAWLWQDS